MSRLCAIQGAPFSHAETPITTWTPRRGTACRALSYRFLTTTRQYKAIISSGHRLPCPNTAV